MWHSHTVTIKRGGTHFGTNILSATDNKTSSLSLHSVVQHILARTFQVQQTINNEVKIYFLNNARHIVKYCATSSRTSDSDC